MKPAIYILLWLAVVSRNTANVPQTDDAHVAEITTEIFVTQSDWHAGENISGQIVYTNKGKRDASYTEGDLPSVRLINPQGGLSSRHYHYTGTEPSCGGVIILVEEIMKAGDSIKKDFFLATCPSEHGGYLVQAGLHNLVIRSEKLNEHTEVIGSAKEIRFLDQSVCKPVDRELTYIVKQGDTLNQIAERFKLSLERLVRMNGIKNPDSISVGYELFILPPDQPIAGSLGQ
jgi:nucleoid-associated protein YgaU